MSFRYSTSATALRTGTYTALSTLDLANGIGTAPRPGAASPQNENRNGNANANRAARTGTLENLTWNTGSNLWIRWVDSNLAGNDDGIAVDDFSFRATAFSATTTTSLTTGNFDSITVQNGVVLTISGGAFDALRVVGTGQVNLIGSSLNILSSASGSDVLGDYTDYDLEVFLQNNAGNPEGLQFRDYTLGRNGLLFNGENPFAVAPEPGSLALLMLGIPGIATVVRRRK